LDAKDLKIQEYFKDGELQVFPGAVTEPCLHFELRENGVPIDPMEYLDLID